MWSEIVTELIDKEKSDDLPPMSSLEVDAEEVKKEKGLEISIPNKLLTIISTNKSWKQFIQTNK